MAIAKLDMPNVSGKTVESIALHDDPASGREISIRFTDDTELSVMIGFRQMATVRHFEVKSDTTLFERIESNL